MKQQMSFMVHLKRHFFRPFQLTKLVRIHYTQRGEPKCHPILRNHLLSNWIWEIYLQWWSERGEHYQRWCNDGGWFSYSGLINKSTFGIPIKKVCPSLWTQLFIISCKVDETTYVPCVYALLPGKSKTGYWTMFQLVREALNSRGLELAAEWMMSDFEYNIRSAFSEVFPNITLKPSRLQCLCAFCSWSPSDSIGKNAWGREELLYPGIKIGW